MYKRTTHENLKSPKYFDFSLLLPASKTSPPSLPQKLCNSITTKEINIVKK